MKVKKMTWDDIPVHDNAPRMRELTKQELQQVSGAWGSRDVCNASIISANLATAATIAPTPPPAKIVTGAIAIASVLVASVACPMSGRTSF